MNIIEFLLNRITMYRLVLYILIALLIIAGVFGFLGIISYSPISILGTVTLLIITCWCMNTFMAYVFEAPTNIESSHITALILALIITPLTLLNDIPFIIWAGVLSMASKYILAINKKHVFNPAAIAVVLTDIAGIGSASWWVGTLWLMPFVLVGGYLIIRKLEFEDMLWSYLSVAIITGIAFTTIQGGDVLTTLNQLVFRSSLFFLGGIMLTEPLTLPPTKHLQMVYGAFVGFLSIPFVHLGPLSFTPELALVFGNIFAYLVSSKQKLVLTVQEKIQASSDTIDFIFNPNEKLAYLPGQYMEWTIPHTRADSRGNRRYFTLASSPTEPTIRLGVKFHPHGSTYKQAMQNLDESTVVVGAQLAGDFTLPEDTKKKLVFMAGGIGITPFRSMVKYSIDTNQKRDIKLLYSAKTPSEFAYTDIFEQGRTQGIETFYTITDTTNHYPAWHHNIGRITAENIREVVPDYLERTFYLSGPYSMLTAYEETLKALGVKNKHIKKDFFPGLV